MLAYFEAEEKGIYRPGSISLPEKVFDAV